MFIEAYNKYREGMIRFAAKFLRDNALAEDTVPVSYTHLDVYKRQVCDRKIFWYLPKAAGGSPLSPIVWFSVRLCIVVWLGDGFPTIIRSVF